MKIATLLEVEAEAHRAQSLFPAYHSPHEALGVLLEEFEEFKAEVMRHNIAKGRDTRTAMREELKQIAAVAIRAMEDVCG